MYQSKETFGVREEKFGSSKIFRVRLLPLLAYKYSIKWHGKLRTITMKDRGMPYAFCWCKFWCGQRFLLVISAHGDVASLSVNGFDVNPGALVNPVLIGSESSDNFMLPVLFVSGLWPRSRHTGFDPSDFSSLAQRASVNFFSSHAVVAVHWHPAGNKFASCDKNKNCVLWSDW